MSGIYKFSSGRSVVFISGENTGPTSLLPVDPLRDTLWNRWISVPLSCDVPGVWISSLMWI